MSITELQYAILAEAERSNVPMGRSKARRLAEKALAEKRPAEGQADTGVRHLKGSWRDGIYSSRGSRPISDPTARGRR